MSSRSIPYRCIDEYLPVDIEKLRPKGSYGKLMETRSHPIDNLLGADGKIPSDLLEERACPNCGSNRSEFELEKDHLTLHRCMECNVVYTSPVFKAEHYREVYQSEAYSSLMKDLGIESHEYRVQRFGTERVNMMIRHLEGIAVPRYLDVGCSTGFVLEAAAKLGWSVSGVELNPIGVDFAKSRGLEVECASLEDCSYPKESFDVISLFDVLEHILDPSALIQQAMGLLKPGGILFLYVPNYDSASRLLMGSDAHFIWPTHHLTYFTPDTISDFLNRRGLRVETLVTEGLDLVDYIWQKTELEKRDMTALAEIADKLQFFINAGCYGKNLRVIARK